MKVLTRDETQKLIDNGQIVGKVANIPLHESKEAGTLEESINNYTKTLQESMTKQVERQDRLEKSITIAVGKATEKLVSAIEALPTALESIPNAIETTITKIGSAKQVPPNIVINIEKQKTWLFKVEQRDREGNIKTVKAEALDK